MRDTFSMLFAIPPDLKQAKLHGEAQKARFYEPDRNYINCKCFCWGRISPEFSRYIGLWESENKIIEYGDGLPLLFQFIRLNILIFLLLFLIQGVYMVIVGIVLYTTDYNENVSLISLFSVVSIMDSNQNVNKPLVYIYEAISLISNFFLIGFISIMWIKQAKYKNYLDENATTDADFAVMIKNLPLDISKGELYDLILRAGVEESHIVYHNKWYAFEHILKLKKKQFYWLQKRKYLEFFKQK